MCYRSKRSTHPSSAFPALNADAEPIHALRDVCGAPTTLVWHTERYLPAGTDVVAIPGGFSYGDYLRAARSPR